MKKLAGLIITLVLTLPLSHAQALGTLTIGPYIQNVSDEAATIMLRTANSETVTLYYKNSTADNWKQATDNTAGTEHRFRLTSLHRHRTYEYYLADSDGRLTQTYTFNTERKIKKKSPLKIAVVGDSGLASTNQYDIAMQMQRWRPELILHTGDVAYYSGTEQDFIDRFFTPYQALAAEVPFYLTIGNHDYVTDSAGPYKAFFDLPKTRSGNEEYYAFDYDTIHFISLNANTSYAVGSDQYNWLVNDLASAKAQQASWRIVFFHQPVYSSGGHGSTADMATTIQPVFEQYDVDLVLNGHDHDYERNATVNGVRYIVTGGGGNTTLYTQDHPELNPYTQIFESVYHFVGLTVTNTSIKIRAINDQGQIFDEFSIKK